MDSLNKYKEVWKNQNLEHKIDLHSLNQMIHKKSSSIVKWIFYVSLFEFALVLVLNIAFKSDWDMIKAVGLYNFIKAVDVLGYVILIVFIVLFYRNYKNISVNHSTKELMYSIIKTRNTVKYYIIINLVFIAIAMFYSFNVILKNDEYEQIMESLGKNGHLLVWSVVVFAILFIVGIMYLFYSLIYGILIKKLKLNYQELIEEAL